MADLAGLSRSGLLSGDNLAFVRGLRGADRAAGQKPWQVAGRADPRSVARGGGARRDIRRANRQERPPGREFGGKPMSAVVRRPSRSPGSLKSPFTKTVSQVIQENRR